MIFGVGVDIAKVSRLEKWVTNPEMTARFFNQKEFGTFGSKMAACEHYAARFAAKEAFGKALGTGIFGFELTDIYIVNTESGKPELIVEGKAAEILKNKCGNSKIHVSLSHEKEFATAFVVIEQI